MFAEKKKRKKKKRRAKEKKKYYPRENKNDYIEKFNSYKPSFNSTSLRPVNLFPKSSHSLKPKTRNNFKIQTFEKIIQNKNQN